MATLTLRQGLRTWTLSFEAPQLLSALLDSTDASFAHPCGGRGVCGKCAVTVSGCASVPNEAERRLGVRLACQVHITGDAEVTLPTQLPLAQIEGGRVCDLQPIAPMKGRFGAAVDLGTTTIVLQLHDLHMGRSIGAASMLNPQTSVAADVIGRIDASMKGRADELRAQVTSAIQTLLTAACAQADIHADAVDALVITGNTTMLYLLNGQDPTSLSRAPFVADCLFGCDAALWKRQAYLPRCLHAFVGADTTCALLASSITQQPDTALLCDVGTNGEIALWHQGRLYVASTAAGPAFEGAGIRCGCANIPGAIDHAEAAAGNIRCHTIGEGKAVGLCGSGLVDVIAAALDTGALDETGLLEDDPLPLRDGVSLVQEDIRAVQLAKAAIHAGIMSLLSAAHCPVDEVTTFYLAGGFGSHLSIRSAVRIGLIPNELAQRVRVIGNAALDGAAMLLMDTTLRQRVDAMVACATHVRLDGNAEFVERYVEAMLFPEA
ncbi:MAG: ASKHA domain-containing protein [Clostridiales bacterium]|nr:ASKHA domain-containing protein [Clostridiales bacterium]